MTLKEKTGDSSVAALPQNDRKRKRGFFNRYAALPYGKEIFRFLPHPSLSDKFL